MKKIIIMDKIFWIMTWTGSYQDYGVSVKILPDYVNVMLQCQLMSRVADLHNGQNTNCRIMNRNVITTVDYIVQYIINADSNILLNILNILVWY